MAKTPSSTLQPGDPRLMIRWARTYAKSRTISFLVQWVFIVLMVLVIGTAGTLTNMAYMERNMVLVTISAAFMGLTILVLAWFSISPWGGELIWRITQWMYGPEGYVAYSRKHADGPAPWWITLLGGGLVIYHLVGALLVTFGYLPLLYMQPYSAVYMSAFLIVMILYQDLGFWAWLWPVLYGLHGLLIYLGFPLAFQGQYQLLNMVVPVFGYGLLAIVVGHIYSRYALMKLRSLARTHMPQGEPEEDPEVEDGEDEGEGKRS
jgi:hypothetical protein